MTILVYRFSKRREKRIEGSGDLIPWLWLSIGMRVAGVILGLIALGQIWQYEGIGGSGYYIGSMAGYDGRDYISMLDMSWLPDYLVSGSIVVLVFLLATTLSLLTWKGAFVSLVTLLAYYGLLLGEYGHGNLLWQSNLNVGVPFGDGYVMAWISVFLVLLSGLIWLHAKREPGVLFVRKVI